jgi:CRP-like cAMP-binding protein
MYSTLEKTIILKSTTLFSLIAAETLSRVAQMAEEVSFSAGAAVYREGAPGAALYIVASGAVSVTAGSLDLGVLRRGESFGEIAVLNRDVYRAEVIAAEDTVLLRIEQEDMFELMQSNTEIMQGIISLLARRVVQVGDVLRKSDRQHVTSVEPAKKTENNLTPT